MMALTNLLPDADYQSRQKSLGELCLSGGFRKKLVQSLEDDFKRTFGLSTKNRSNRDYQVETWLSRTCRGTGIDHVRVYKTSTSIVFVSQPYCLPDQGSIDALVRSGVTVVDVTPWTYYFPGRSKCVVLDVEKTVWEKVSALARKELGIW